MSLQICLLVEDSLVLLVSGPTSLSLPPVHLCLAFAPPTHPPTHISHVGAP